MPLVGATPPRAAQRGTVARVWSLIDCCPPAFDPKPHIRTLEHALSQLLPLRKANAARTNELERSVAQAERAYRGDVRGAKAGFEVRLPYWERTVPRERS